MLKLSPQDRQQLRNALTSSYRRYPDLRIFISDHFELRLDEIVSSQALKIATDELVTEFEQIGNISDLIWALQQERPRNPDVQILMQRLQGFIQQRFILDPGESEPTDYPFELPTSYTDVQLEGFLARPLSFETDVGKLRRGLRLANAVCKIAFSDRPTTGTGVLIASDLVLTNYHILSKQVLTDEALAEKAKTILFEFGFVSEEHDSPISPDTFTVEATKPLLAASSPDVLDYALLRVEPKITSASYDYIQPVAIPTGMLMPTKEQGLNVLQHPQGNVMQVSLSASGVVQIDAARGRVWYVNRTQGGSSGSPCFNSDWQMVALHHASMSRGFGSVREGILLPSIVAEISGFLEK